MKKIIPILLLSMFTVFSACNKDEINNTEDKVGISRVTRFPILTMNGDRYMAVAVGGTFTDPGVTAKEGSTTIPVTKSGTVNTATPGVYDVTYTAKNKDGFAASLTRTVAVYSTDAIAAANDLSGNYARTSNGSVSTWTKIAPGVYTVFNPGGAPGTNLTVIAFNSTGNTIKIPLQMGPDGRTTTSSNESYTPLPAPARYSWVIVNAGYGTALRTFIKQ
jgi:hypothetical protein